MEKKLAVEVVGEVRKAAKEMVSLIAEAELAVKSGDNEVMREALNNVVSSKRAVLLRLAAVAGMIEGNLNNRGLLSKMWGSLKG